MSDKLNPPSFSLPAWASGNYPAGSDPWSGTPKRVTPPASGFTPGVLPAEHLNDVLATTVQGVNASVTYLNTVYDMARTAQYQIWQKLPTTDNTTHMPSATYAFYNKATGHQALYVASGGSMAYMGAPGGGAQLPAQAAPLDTAYVCGALGSTLMVGGIKSGTGAQTSPLRFWSGDGNTALGINNAFFTSDVYPVAFHPLPGTGQGIIFCTTEAQSSAIGLRNNSKFGGYGKVSGTQDLSAIFWDTTYTTSGQWQSNLIAFPASVRTLVRRTGHGSPRFKVRAAMGAGLGEILALVSLDVADYDGTNASMVMLKSSSGVNGTWTDEGFPNPFTAYSGLGTVEYAGPGWVSYVGYVVIVTLSLTAGGNITHMYTSFSGNAGTWGLARVWDNSNVSANTPIKAMIVSDLVVGQDSVFVAVLRNQGNSGAINAGNQSMIAVAHDPFDNWHLVQGISSNSQYEPGIALTTSGAPVMVACAPQGFDTWASCPIFGVGQNPVQ